jgi:hypothetical protein
VGKLLGKFLAGRLRKWEVDNTNSRLDPVVDFDISSVTFKLHCYSVRRGKKTILKTEMSQT